MKKERKEKEEICSYNMKEMENRGKRREIRAVFAPRQAVYSSKLYLVFSVPATLACLFLALRACVWQFLPAPPCSPQQINQAIFPNSPTQSNQSHFTVWQSFILQFGRVKSSIILLPRMLRN